MQIRTVAASVGDALHIAPLLRQADRNELVAYGGYPPEICLPDYVADSKYAYAVYKEACPVLEPLCLFGLQEHPEDPSIGVPWMVGTDLLTREPITFLRKAPWFIEQFNSLYPLLANFVDARNELHVRWLKAMGFTFTDLIPMFGVAQLPFWRFTRGRYV
jgi:hypothetical protein